MVLGSKVGLIKGFLTVIVLDLIFLWGWCVLSDVFFGNKVDQWKPPSAVGEIYWVGEGPGGWWLYQLPGDSIRDHFIPTGWRSPATSHVNSPSQKGHQQNCQGSSWINVMKTRLHTSSETSRHRWYRAGSKYWWNQGLAAWFRAKSTTQENPLQRLRTI